MLNSVRFEGLKRDRSAVKVQGCCLEEFAEAKALLLDAYINIARKKLVKAEKMGQVRCDERNSLEEKVKFLEGLKRDRSQ